MLRVHRMSREHANLICVNLICANLNLGQPRFRPNTQTTHARRYAASDNNGSEYYGNAYLCQAMQRQQYRKGDKDGCCPHRRKRQLFDGHALKRIRMKLNHEQIVPVLCKANARWAETILHCAQSSPEFVPSARIEIFR